MRLANLGLVAGLLFSSTSFTAAVAGPSIKKAPSSSEAALWFGEQELGREDKIDPLQSSPMVVHKTQTAAKQFVLKLATERADAIAREALNRPDQPAFIQVDFSVDPIDTFQKRKRLQSNGDPIHWGKASLLSAQKSKGTPHLVRNIVLWLAREIVPENTFTKIPLGTEDIGILAVGKVLRLTLSNKVSQDVLDALREEGVGVGSAYIHLRVSDGMELAEFKYEGANLREFLGLGRAQSVYQACRLKLSWLP